VDAQAQLGTVSRACCCGVSYQSSRYRPSLSMLRLSQDPERLTQAVKEFMFAATSISQSQPPTPARKERSNTGASSGSGFAGAGAPISPVQSQHRSHAESIASQDSFASATSDLRRSRKSPLYMTSGSSPLNLNFQPFTKLHPDLPRQALPCLCLQANCEGRKQVEHEEAPSCTNEPSPNVD